MPHHSTLFKAITITGFLISCCQLTIYADNWNTGPGGLPSRHSLSTEIGPSAANLLWQKGVSSVIAQQAVIDGAIVATSRITNLSNTLFGTSIVAQDLYTGDTLWTKILPVDFPDTDWRSRVSAMRNGVIYATRSGNTNESYMYALDAESGATLWRSQDLVSESSTEGASFASNGDLIVGNNKSILRISAIDGATIWETDRTSPTSNGQEVAIFGGRGYYWEASFNGPKVSVIDLETGTYLFSSEALSPGLIQQLSIFVGPDGTVYAPRSMNNPTTDFLFALKDTGTAFEQLWQVPLGFVPFATFGVGPDGSIYSYSRNGKVIRLSPSNGIVLDSSLIILTENTSSPRMAVDRNGQVFITNGEFDNGALYAFNADLSLRWSEAILNVNVGGPAIGEGGTLIVCGIGTNVRAYQGTYSVFANFSAGQSTICNGDSITFFEQGNGAINSWAWTFEGGTPATADEPEPVVTYSDAGVFDVELIVSDGLLKDTLLLENYITVEQCTTPIDELFNSMDMDIFPNPAIDHCIIELDIVRSGRIRLELVDGLGRLQHLFKFEAQAAQVFQKTISLDGMQAGIYFIRAWQKDVLLATEKLVIYK